MQGPPATIDPFSAWLSALEVRHFASVAFSEMRRGLQALSTIYVERRERIASGAAFDGAGKRAAFAVFYGPIHFMVVSRIARALGAASPPLRIILDLGCGTGASGAGWAIEACGFDSAAPPRLTGVDCHPWAIEEARWTWRTLGLSGHARRGEAERKRLPGRESGILAAYTVNELPAAGRDRLLRGLLDAAARGARVLIIEPIARAASPWWDAWAEAFLGAGGRSDDWRFEPDLPETLARLDRAAGLDHRELTARSLWLSGAT